LQHCNCGDYWHVPGHVLRAVREGLCSGQLEDRWIVLEEGAPNDGGLTVNTRTGRVSGCEVSVDAGALHDSTLAAYDTFYVCQGCGHVYWAGSHQRRYMAALGGVLHGGNEGACGGPEPAEAALTSGIATMSMACDPDTESEDDAYFY